MQFIARLLLCAGVAIAVAGCDPADKQYFRKGIGTQLPPADLVESTNDLETYIDAICWQAGLANGSSKSCGIGSDTRSESNWRLFVQTGMNDIDRRCDGYLVWLDNIRRAEAPTLKQISDTHVATQLVLTATSAGIVPMALVATAFGYAADTLTNINSRLILTVNQSTVQAVVLGKQTEFRKDLLGDGKTKPKVIIDSRPAAIHALRSYMRLCMPMTIETEINNTIVAYQSGGIDAYKNNPMISAVSIARANFDVGKPIEPTPPHRKYIANPVGDIEKLIDYDRGKRIQRALCVRREDADFGDMTSETRRNLRAFKAALVGAAVSEKTGVLEGPKDLENLTGAVDKFPSCVRARFASAYEMGTLARFGVVDFRTKQLRPALENALKTAQAESNKQVVEKITPRLIADVSEIPSSSVIMDKSIRTAIGILNDYYKMPGGQTIDHAFINELVKRTSN